MRFSDDARRARLARRHGLHPDHALDDPVSAARALVGLHATDPSTVHLSVAARVPSADVAMVERALYDERSLVKQLAMRRTLFALPRDLLPAVWGSVSARVAAQQSGQLTRDLERHGVTDDGASWIEQARTAVLARLANGEELSARRLREELPELAGRTAQVGDSKWYVANLPFAPRLLTLLGAEHSIVRGHNEGHWRTPRALWTLMASWLGETPEGAPPNEGYAALVGAWLERYGPGTEDDLVWWSGATRTTVRTALADLGAISVELDSGLPGYVLPGDEIPERPAGGWVALLPVLDPTTMGWKQRDFYLDPALARYLFDSNGNGGTTAWVDGRIVGCWVQDEHGRVRVIVSAPLPAGRRRQLEAEAERLTAFLDGVVIANVYKSRLMKQEPLP